MVISDHGSQGIVRPLLRKILWDLGLSVNEYTHLLEEQRDADPKARDRP